MIRFVVGVLFVIVCTTAGAQSKEVLSPVEFEKRLASVTDKYVIDVRTADEYARGHVAGAIMIDYYKNDFKAKFNKLDKSKPVFIYCASGGRSGSATEVLTELGFKQVYDLKGGFLAWTKAGRPVIK